MDLALITIALSATLFFFVWIKGKKTSFLVLLLFLLAVFSIPSITSLIDRHEALTISCAALLAGSLLSFIKVPFENEDIYIRVIRRLLHVSFIFSLISYAILLYHQQYPMQYHEYAQIAVLLGFSVSGFLVFVKAMK